jgi:hypothetical protein
MKTIWTAVLAAIVLCLSSCKAPAPTPVLDAGTGLPLLKTTMGDFIIVSARLVDEVHGDKPLAGEKFLLVSLARPGLVKLVPGEFSLEDFSAMVRDSGDEIYILGDNGTQTFSTGMGGWIEEEFVMGFRVAVLDKYTLYWPGNLPLDLDVEE